MTISFGPTGAPPTSKGFLPDPEAPGFPGLASDKRAVLWSSLFAPKLKKGFNLIQ